MSKHRYDESSIKVLKDLEPVRSKPNFYVGSLDKRGLFICFKEPFDNAVDEILNGHGKNLYVEFDPRTHMITVADEGRGIPVGIHKETKESTLTTVLTKLHAGGKLDASQKGYKNSRGTFGVGVSVTNALAEKLDAYTYRDNKWHCQSFGKGAILSKVKVTKPLKWGFKPKCGTTIQFIPELKLFGKDRLTAEDFIEWLRASAYLHSGVRFHFSNAKTGKKEVFYQKDGSKAYIEDRLTALNAEKVGKPFSLTTPEISLIMQWSSHPDEDFNSYVNGSKTSEGGTHLTGLQQVMTKGFDKFRTKRTDFRPEDLWAGLVGILNINIGQPEFGGATKNRLTSKDAADTVKNAIGNAFEKFLDGNKSLAKEVIRRACELRAAQKQFTLSKAAAANLKTSKAGKLLLPSKLTMCNSKNPEECELFLVEGDSAAGTAEQARNSNTQAVLALKGKPLNVYKAQPAKIMKNAEILDMLQAIGYNPSLKDPFSNRRFGRIIILSDADEDGKHINILVSAFAFKMLRPLIEQGRLYTVVSSLFTTQIGSKRINANSLDALLKKLPANTKKPKITRLKGWGEANPDELLEQAFDYNTRKLRQITMPDAKGERAFINIVGKDTEARRELMGLGGEKIDA